MVIDDYDDEEMMMIMATTTTTSTSTTIIIWNSTRSSLYLFVTTEALKGHRVLWKIEICYLIRMT